jgi:3-oxoacyl-[acyl-carrier protein] reductase
MTTSPRVAIVTGAGRGIGAGIARRLASDGIAVGVLDLDVDTASAVADSICDAGGKAVGVAADVSDDAAVRAAVTEVATTLGPPVIVVNNAGVTRDNLLFKMTDDDWTVVMDVHLRGAFHVARAAQKYMVDGKWGRIINISSQSALGNRGQVNYSAAKAGLQGFTKTAAIELGPFGVTVNAIGPGFIATPMTNQTAANIGMSFEDYQASVAEQLAVRRVGQPEDIAHAVSYFASEGAGFVTGQVLYVTGTPVN